MMSKRENCGDRSIKIGDKKREYEKSGGGGGGERKRKEKERTRVVGVQR